MNNDGNTARFSARRQFLNRQAELELGLQEMERGLRALGARIEDCRDQMAGPSEIENMAVNASRLERKFLSLRKKLKAPEAPMDQGTKAAIRELAEKNRVRRFNTRALERETRRNSRILNALADKLKTELNKKRAEELKAAREKAAKVKLAQNPPRVAKPTVVKPAPKKSADIIPFPTRGKK